MPWNDVTPMSERLTFVQLASVDGANMSELCRRFNISRRTGYKWLGRSVDNDVNGPLINKSRRPHNSPGQTAEYVEDAIVELRSKHPSWGAFKIRTVLRRDTKLLVPAHSTINRILHRRGLIDASESPKHQPWLRFEYERPNDLWQIDFKGHFALTHAVQRCHPLTVLDDHSRFSIAIRACAFETYEVVYNALVNIFRQYGLPLCILCDNGPPWGAAGAYPAFTAMDAWLIQLGIHVKHGKPYHPQTQGKEERFHRTLKAEVLKNHTFKNHLECQQAFDTWREIYNCVRPHQALKMMTPATHYSLSVRPYPKRMPKTEYGPDDIKRIVQAKGEISFKGQTYKVGKAFTDKTVAMRASATDGVYDVYFCTQRVSTIDLR